MSTTTLVTRIQNKFDTLANWESNKSRVLLKGEPAFVQVPSNSTAIDGDETRPQYLLKVGDGVTTFENLSWVSGLAADVFDWAKAASKPSYVASEISELSTYISSYVTDTMGLSSDTDTQYQLEQDPVDGHKIRINYKSKGESTWSEGEWITIPDNSPVYTLESFGITATAEEINVLDGVVATTTELNYLDGVTSNIQEQLNAKATAEQGTKADNAMPKSGGTFTGAVTFDGNVTFKGATVVEEPIANNHPATKGYVDSAILDGFAANDAMVFKGVVNSASDLPINYSAGYTYRIGTAGTYFGSVCEVGDLLICVSDKGSAVSDEDWVVVQSNVNKPGYFDGNTITDGTVLVADGTGGQIKSVNLATSDPTASGNSLTFISTVSQAANGKITATKKSVTVDSTYSSTSNNPISGAGVAAAIGTLDVEAINVSASKTVKAISETDGKIAVTTQDIAIAQSQVTNLTTDLAAKQPKFEDGTATIASVLDNVVTLKAGLSQSGGQLSNSSAEDIVLAKVAKSGKIDDLSQSEGHVLILNCGTASTVF